MSAFDPRPRPLGPTLELRPLASGGLDGLHAAAGDPATWAGARGAHLLTALPLSWGDLADGVGERRSRTG